MKLESVLRTMIKLAAVALTAPATWAVAGQLYTAPIQRITVQIAALVLVEAALLLGWHMLDNSASATPGQRGLYATLTVTAYFVLWAVAIRHGEGLAGIGFRATLGVLIGYSVMESGLLAGVKLRQAADRDITRHWKVKTYRRKLAIGTARLAADAESDITRRVIELDKTEWLDNLSAERANQFDPVHILDVQKSRVSRQRTAKQAKMGAALDVLRDNPTASVREIAEQIGRSHSTVSVYLRELETSGQIARNGHGVKVLTN
jgi:DNA-binding transcriptional ArsR family regulator